MLEMRGGEMRRSQEGQHMKFTRNDETGAHVTLKQAREYPVGTVFGLARPEGSGRRGFAMKRVLTDEGTFGALNGGEISGDWSKDQLKRLVVVGSPAAEQQAPKARAKSRARKAQRKSTKSAPKERSQAQHAATHRMLLGKVKLQATKAGKRDAQRTADAYAEAHGV